MDDIDTILASIETIATEQNTLIQRQQDLIKRQQGAIEELRELVLHELEHSFIAGRHPAPSIGSSGGGEEDIPSESEEDSPEEAAPREATAAPATPTETASVLETIVTRRVRPEVFHINDRVKFLKGKTTAAGEGIVVGFTNDNPPGLRIRRINRRGGRHGRGKPGDPVIRGPFSCPLLSREEGTK